MPTSIPAIPPSANDAFMAVGSGRAMARCSGACETAPPCLRCPLSQSNPLLTANRPGTIGEGQQARKFAPLEQRQVTYPIVYSATLRADWAAASLAAGTR